MNNWIAEPQHCPTLCQVRRGAWATLLAAALALSLSAATSAYWPHDATVADRFRSVDWPALTWLFQRANDASSLPGLLIIWLPAVLVVYGRGWRTAALLLLAGGGIGAAASAANLPPLGAVLLYGLILYLAAAKVRDPLLRFGLAGASSLVLALAGPARIWEGIYLPSDIVGGYLLGALALAAAIYAHRRFGPRLSQLLLLASPPLPFAAAAAHPWVKTTGSLASRVYLDGREGTATKVYAPTITVRALYWLAFQAPFPYFANEAALWAASYRRKIAGLITKHFFGEDLVAPAVVIRCQEGQCAFVTQLVEGGPPKSRRRARQFLRQVASHFQAVGLPTWQVLPANPKAPGNLIEGPEGGYRIIDLESALVTPFVPFSQLGAALRTGNFPAFDDVDFERLDAFITANEGHLASTLGTEGLLQLKEAAARCAEYTHRWRASEPRLWGRLFSFLYRLLDVPGHIRRLSQQAQASGNLARVFVERGIERWARTGRLSPAQAAALEEELGTSETAAALAHLGVHIGMSIALRFPLGSVARLLWTLFFRLSAEWRILRRRAPDGPTSAARSTHTLPVMLLAAIPGLGTVAYLAAAPLRKNRALLAVVLDQALSKLPFRIYERLHLDSLTLWLAWSRPAHIHLPRKCCQLLELAKPAHLAGEALASLRSLRPHLKPISLILGLNIAALVIAVGINSVRGNTGSFDERGGITALKALELLTAGAFGQLAFFSFWRKPQLARAGAYPGIFFWLTSGWGLWLFAIDDYFQVHEQVGRLFAGRMGTALFLNNVDDLIILAYAVLGLTAVYLFRREILSSRASATLLALGVAWSALMVGVDFFAPEGSVLASVENPANVLAVAFILTAYVAKHKEVSRRSPVAERRRLTTPSALASPAPSLPEGIPARAYGLSATLQVGQIYGEPTHLHLRRHT